MMRLQLAKAVQVGANDICNLRVAARSLLFDKQDYWLPIARNLHRAQRHALGEHVPIKLQLQRCPLEPNSGSVCDFRDAISLVEKSALCSVREQIPLWPLRNSKHGSWHKICVPFSCESPGTKIRRTLANFEDIAFAQ